MLPLTLLQELAHQRTSTALAAAERHRLSRVVADERQRETTVARLRSLLEAAAETPLDDHAGWQVLRVEATGQTSDLAESGQLPPSLVVAPDDAPVVVARTIAAAWRHLSRVAARPEGPVRPRRDP